LHIAEKLLIRRLRKKNTHSAICQLYHDGQFNWRRKPEYQEKTKDNAPGHLKTGATSGTGIAYPSGTPEFTPGF